MMQSRFPARSVRENERLSKLERDLAKLEAIVEQLVSTINAEHEMMKESRQGDREALRDLSRKMERSVANLADEMKRLADRSAAIDATVLAKQSQALGAIAVTRWVIGTGIAAGMLFMTYQAGQNNRHVEPSRHQLQWHQGLMVTL